MISSSLGSKTLRTATLCVVLLFMPTTSCGWLDQKPTARNQALISGAALVVAPVLDGILRNIGSLSSLDGWKKLPKALKVHIAQSLFAEGIKAREKNESFFAHKARIAGTYAAENPVFLLTLALVIANATHSLKTEFDRQNPNAAALTKAQQALADAEAKVTDLTRQLKDTTTDKDNLAGQLADAQRTQRTAENALHALREEHGRCAAPGDAEARLRELTATHNDCGPALRAEQQRVNDALAAHRDCATTREALEAELAALGAQLERLREEAAGDDHGDAPRGPKPPARPGAVDDHLGGAFGMHAMRSASALRAGGKPAGPDAAPAAPKPADDAGQGNGDGGEEEDDD